MDSVAQQYVLIVMCVHSANCWITASVSIQCFIGLVTIFIYTAKQTLVTTWCCNTLSVIVLAYPNPCLP